MSLPADGARASNPEGGDQPVFWQPSLAFIKVSIGCMLGSAVIYEIVLYLSAPGQSARALAVGFIVLVATAAWGLLSGGRARAAVRLLAAGVWLHVTVTAFFLGGVAAASVILFDIGGGSTELVLGLDGRAVQTMSEPLGALTVTRDWLGPDPVSPQAVAYARAQIRAALAPVVGAFRGRPALRAVATSGTIQRVARIACVQAGDPRADVHGLQLTATALRQVVAAMQAAPTLADRLRIPGMDASRADILLGGTLIYEALTDLLDLPLWTVSMAGLRMGVIHELLAR